MKEIFMKAAIDEAYKGINSGEGGPFGAVIVKNDKIIGTGHNTVLKDNDPTQHAEIRVISLVSREENSFDLSGCEIYSTTEPCPMCFSGIHWAKLDRITFGTSIEDVARLGFNELFIHAETMKEKGSSNVEIVSDFMRDECMELLEYWKGLEDKRIY